jgi:DNA-binding SARP family transcriptional activator
MEIRVLGPIEVSRDGGALPFGGERRTTLLALLCVRLDVGLTAEELAREMWGSEASAAAVTLRSHLSRLRGLLGSSGEEPVLASRGHRYRLDTAAFNLDAARFEAAVARLGRDAGISLEERSDELADALALWRGPPYETAGTTPILDAERVRLDRARSAAQEDRIAADMDLGRHRRLLSELEALAVSHPLDQRLASMYALCLYRSGRAAESVRAVQSVQHELRATTGLDPSHELVSLEHSILSGDPALDWSPSPVTPAPGSRPLDAVAQDRWGAGESELLVGQQLLRAGRMAEALARLREGISRVEHAGAAPDGGSRACDLFLALAEAHVRLRDVASAKAAALAAANMARMLGDRSRLGRAAVLGTFVNTLGDRDDAIPELCEEALGLLGEDELALQATVLAGRADYEAVALGDGRRAAQTARGALAVAQRSRDPVALSRCLWIQLDVLGWTPRVGERLVLAERLVALAGTTDDAEAEYFGLKSRAINTLVLGDLATFDRELARLETQGRDVRDGYSRIQVLLWRGMRAIMDRRFDDVEPAIASLLTLASREPNVQNLATGQLFAARWEEGRLDEYLPILEEHVRRVPGIPAFAACLALARAVCGDVDGAARVLSDIVRDGGVESPRDPTWTTTLCLLAEVAVLVGDATVARVLLRELAPYRGQLAVLSGGVACTGSMDRYLARLNCLVGPADAARSLFESALAIETATGCPTLTARTRADFGCWLVAEGRGDDLQRGQALCRQAERSATRRRRPSRPPGCCENVATRPLAPEGSPPLPAPPPPLSN